ncbi:DUF4232 domain-containing protein [Streptomyces sp. NPDC048448]|uniref:DUF4232 domain-containing protein n=1 Tax=Streptomyces sp. NPDC048448 TaxID=3365554 RepID=UPI003716EF46
MTVPCPRPSCPRPLRSAVLAGALALAVSGCGFFTEPDHRPAPGPSPAVAVPPAGDCPPSGVRVDAGRVDGAMGLRAMSLTLTNCSGRPYRMNGYPSVRVLDEKGAPLTGVRTVQGTDKVPMAPEDPGVEPFTLTPGGSARAALYWRMAAENGTYLRVVPQKGRAAVDVRPPETLDIGPENTLGTTAWAPSPS